MINKLGRSLLLGIFSYLCLGVFPYFAGWWRAFFGIIIFFLSLRLFRTAVFLTLTTVIVPIAYHSFELLILYLLLVLPLCILAAIFFKDFPAVFLIVAGAPFLTFASLYGQPIPIEFVITFCAALFLKAKKATIMSGVAGLWCGLVGILSGQRFLGNLIVGNPLYEFVKVKELTITMFYDLSWVGREWSRFLEDGLTRIPRILLQILAYLVSYPQIILNAVVWAAVTYILVSFLEKKKIGFDLLGVALGAVLLISMQFIVLALYPGGSDYDFVGFILRVCVGMIMAFMVYTLSKLIKSYLHPAITVEGQPGAVPYALRKPGDLGGLKLKGLSLEGSLKMQKMVQEYIKKRFQREVTALDIDVAQSAKIKENESPEEVIVSFTEYWKLVDKTMLHRKGRLLNRFGDGAIYLFEDAELALNAARDMIIELEKFNEKVNTIKSKFSVRIGLNTGEVVHDAAKSSGDVFSRVLDIAGHLQKEAKPLEITISENTFHKIKSQNDFALAYHSEKDNIDVYVYKPVEKSEPDPEVGFKKI